jgi:hypothetical protein
MEKTSKDKDTPGNNSNGNTPHQEKGNKTPFQKCQSNNLGNTGRSSARMEQLLVG